MKLSLWRKECGETQAWLAEKLDCSIATISQIETGKQKPSFELLRKIERLTNNAVKSADFDDETAPVIRSLADSEWHDAERPLVRRRKSVA